MMMFRKMRRTKQELSKAECEKILTQATSGVLAVAGDDGYPYAVPLSYFYEDGKIYFHVAKSGHKIDAITRNRKVSFCVIGQDLVAPEKFTTYYRSVIAFGRARILTDDTERMEALTKLAIRYVPDDEEGRNKEIEKDFANVCMIEIAIDHMTGKESKYLAMAREKSLEEG